MKNPLVKKWFHSRNASGEIEWQGQILAVRDGKVSVQLYEWFFGEAGDQKTVPVDDLKTWNIYKTNAEMLSYYDKYASACWDSDEPITIPSCHAN